MKKIKITVIIILILVIAGCVGYMGWYFVSQKKNAGVYEDIKSEVKTETEENTVPEEEKKVEIPVDFNALWETNPDIYAWISIEGTNIDYPVVQSAEDNSYYLNHTIEGAAGYPGSIYTENYNRKDFTDANTVIYGHDMRDGSMFQNLHNYSDETFMREHPYVIIYTPEKKLTYEIFAAVNYDDRHLLQSFNFNFQGSRQDFLDSIYGSRSFENVIRDDVEVTANNRILTMSTCIASQPDRRFLVEAVLISEEQ